MVSQSNRNQQTSKPRGAAMLTIEKIPEYSPLREEIYQLRYTAYVGACEAYDAWLDHDQKTVRDELDETGRVYAAFLDGELIGTMRANYVNESDLDEYFEQFGLDPAEFPDACVSSRFAVAPKYRGSSAAFCLAAAHCVDALNHGIQFGIINCRPFLVPFYQSLGYKVYRRLEDAT